MFIRMMYMVRMYFFFFLNYLKNVINQQNTIPNILYTDNVVFKTSNMNQFLRRMVKYISIISIKYIIICFLVIHWKTFLKKK
jgi:hypothetical protein